MNNISKHNATILKNNPNGNFKATTSGYLVAISKYNLLGRLVKYIQDYNGNITKRVNEIVKQTLTKEQKDPRGYSELCESLKNSAQFCRIVPNALPSPTFTYISNGQPLMIYDFQALQPVPQGPMPNFIGYIPNSQTYVAQTASFTA